MNRVTSSFSVLSTLLLAVTTLGCASGKQDGWQFTKSLDPRNIIGGDEDVTEPPQMPTRLVSTWQDAVLNQAGKKPERGFGGRVLFFNDDSEDPIRVEGQLVIYAFDENGRAAHETHPTRRYVFPTQQFAKHESECKLGPSYSVWLPWDALGGEQKNISLIARFEPKGGPLIAGDQTRHLLPGTRQLAEGEQAPPVQQVADIQLTEYTQKSKIAAPAKANSAPGRSKPISIALSQESWQKRLTAAQETVVNAAEDSSKAR
ncbi:MAG: hypothetical protein AAGD11_02120 [Planctomycetota bacterium]